MLERLAELLKRQNSVAQEIAAIVGRPAQIGHIGEFIASRVFGILLADSAVHKGSDGVFQEGSLAGKSVNIKWYGKKEDSLDIRPDALPDYFLVLTGPQSTTSTSKGGTRPWSVEFVFLFDARALCESLRQRRVKLGYATSITRDAWHSAQIYQAQNNRELILTAEQRRQLNLFRAESLA